MMLPAIGLSRPRDHVRDVPGLAAESRNQVSVRLPVRMHRPIAGVLRADARQTPRRRKRRPGQADLRKRNGLFQLRLLTETQHQPQAP